jgi:hypothetical protein
MPRRSFNLIYVLQWLADTTLLCIIHLFHQLISRSSGLYVYLSDFMQRLLFFTLYSKAKWFKIDAAGKSLFLILNLNLPLGHTNDQWASTKPVSCKYLEKSIL